MNGPQLDRLLKEKVDRARRVRIFLYVVIAALCVTVIAVAVASINHDIEPSPLDTQNVESLPPTENSPMPSQTEETQPPVITHTLQMLWPEQMPDGLPEKIDISILHGEENVTNFELTAANEWKHSWEDSYPADSLTLRGDFPSTVTVSYSIRGDNFIVKGVCPIPDSNITDSETDRASDSESNLPSTGPIWQPVVLLLLSGIALFAVGRNKADRFSIRRPW